MDWEKVYHDFNPMEPLGPTDPRLYPALFGDFLDTVATRICLNRDKNHKLLLSGHVGSGKSTFLNLLQERNDIKNNFFSVKYSIKDVLDPNDTDHIDLLLSLTLQAVIAAQESRVKIDKKLTEKLKQLAGELQGVVAREEETSRKKTRKTGAEAKAGIGLTNLMLWFKTEFFARLQIENETRESVRRYYKPRMTDFLNTINDLLRLLQVSLNKSLLVLIDDTDKIEPPERALEVFSDNGQFLARPQANIVFVVDNAISCSSKLPIIRSNVGDPEFFPAIKVTERDGSSSPATNANSQMLRELVLKRMDKELIEKQALEKAVEMSGGVVRELVRLLRRAIFKARGKVREDHIDESVISLRNDYNLFPEHVRILKAVLTNPDWFQTASEDIAKVESTLLDLLHWPALFQYRNGEDKWYRPYPIFIPWLEKIKLPEEKPA
jgi:hypothetical protein